MALVSFTPNTTIVSADMNANFTGVTNWSLMNNSSDVVRDHAVAGTGLVAISAGLVGTFSNINYFIGGQAYSLSSIANKTYTASKDTYVDVSTSTVTYTEVATNAASPSLAASNIRMAIVITSGAAITSVNQGSTTAIAPIASNVPYCVTDSLGNLIYPTDPNSKIIGYRQIVANITTASTSAALMSGLSAAAIVPGNRKIKITLFATQFGNSTAANGGAAFIHSAATVNTLTTQLQESNVIPATNNFLLCQVIYQPAAGTLYFSGSYEAITSGTITVGAGATNPAYIVVELA